MLPGDKKENPGAFYGMEMWIPYIKKELQLIKPDIAVVDFFTIPATIVCDELEIPMVLNMPGPVEMYGLSNNIFPANYNTFNCCGYICIKQTWFQWLINTVMTVEYSSPRWKASFDKLPLRVVLINSFWGLDSSRPMPPNCIVTGPLVQSPSNLLKRLQSKDEKLFDWMNNAHSNGTKIVYLSLGTMCGWAKWEVDAFYYGLKEIGCAVVWSIRE
jgi:hypothetical protein